MKNCKKIFISGKMTGLEKYNFPKFDEIEKRLQAVNVPCVNPAHISRQFKEEDVLNNKDVFDEMIRRQLCVMMDCDAILLIGDNWNTSGGAMKELKVAIAKDMKIFLESDLVKLEVEYKGK
jgi:hypothetical protein